MLCCDGLFPSFSWCKSPVSCCAARAFPFYLFVCHYAVLWRGGFGRVMHVTPPFLPSRLSLVVPTSCHAHRPRPLTSIHPSIHPPIHPPIYPSIHTHRTDLPPGRRRAHVGVLWRGVRHVHPHRRRGRSLGLSLGRLVCLSVCLSVGRLVGLLGFLVYVRVCTLTYKKDRTWEM